MEGITILNIIIRNNFLIFALLLYAFGIMYMIASIMMVVVSVQNDEPHFILTLICFSFTLFFLISGYKINKLPTQPRYQITVDDSVSFNDFMERYEIIKQDGEIYTVIEKEK